MPFDKLPGANLNASILSNYRPYIAPARPVFPTYEVVMDALNKLLPAFDPVERGKRSLALASLPVEKAKLDLEMRQIPMQEAMMQRQMELMGHAGSGQPGYKIVGGKVTPWDANDWARYRKSQLDIKSRYHGTDYYNSIDHSKVPHDPSLDSPALPTSPDAPTEAAPPQLIPDQPQAYVDPSAFQTAIGEEIPEEEQA